MLRSTFCHPLFRLDVVQCIMELPSWVQVPRHIDRGSYRSPCLVVCNGQHPVPVQENYAADACPEATSGPWTWQLRGRWGTELLATPKRNSWIRPQLSATGQRKGLLVPEVETLVYVGEGRGNYNKEELEPAWNKDGLTCHPVVVCMADVKTGCANSPCAAMSSATQMRSFHVAQSLPKVILTSRSLGLGEARAHGQD